MLRIPTCLAAACGCLALGMAAPLLAQSSQATNPAAPTAPTYPTMPTTSQPDPATGPTASSTSDSTGSGTASGSASGAYPGSSTAPGSTASAASSATSPADTMGPAASGSNTRLASLLPAGMTAQEACAGFSDPEQCATALHVSQNLSIPFSDLKTKVQAGESVSQAISELKPGADGATEAQHALEQARADARNPQG